MLGVMGRHTFINQELQTKKKLMILQHQLQLLLIKLNLSHLHLGHINQNILKSKWWEMV
jgi:hypothetical protein